VQESRIESSRFSAGSWELSSFAHRWRWVGLEILETDPGRARFLKSFQNPLGCHARVGFPSPKKQNKTTTTSLGVLPALLFLQLS